MEKEVWKKLEGYKYDYEISSLGNARRKQIKTREYKEIGFVGKNGRRAIELRLSNGKQYPFSIARLVAKLFIPNPKRLPYVDHINRNKLDDRVENLRWASASENEMNKSKRIKVKNLSKFKGVTKRPDLPRRANQWQTVVRLKNGKNMYIGSYKTEEEAAKAYNKVAKKEWGKFAYLNTI